MKWLLVILTLLLASPAVAFDYDFISTEKWVPAAGANVLDLWTDVGGAVNLVVIYSATDMRIAVGKRTNAFSAAAAQLACTAADSLLTTASDVSATGHVFYGDFKWLASPAHSDTIMVDCYKRIRRR